MSSAGGAVVVTGGCGFIGPRVCERLVGSGRRVVVLDDFSLGRRENLPARLGAAVDVRRADVRDADAVSRALRESRAATVVHLAAIHFIPRCESDPTGATSVNVGGTEAVLEACARSSSVESVVFASSGAVYRPAAQAHRETDELGPTDVYGRTKLRGEELMRSFYDRTGISVGIARIFNTFGPGETNPHLIPSVILQLKQGDRLHVGRLSTRRDYVFVDDVAAALALVVEAAAEQGLLICNVGSGHAVEGSEVVQLVARLLDREFELVVDERRLRPDDRPVLVGHRGVARARLGWTAAVGLEQGLRAALERPVADEATFAAGGDF